jgi:hypothetical protein
MPTAKRAARSTAKKKTTKRQVRRPRTPASSATSGEPESSAEVIPLRAFEGGATLGFLLLDVDAVQGVIASGLKASGFTMPLVPALAAGAAQAVLAEWTVQTERRLNIEIGTAPFVLGRHTSDDPKYQAKYHDSLLGKLKRLASLLDEDHIGELTGFSFTQFVKERIRRRGSRRQRERLKNLLKKASMGRLGRPRGVTSGMNDVRWAEFVQYMQEGIEQDFKEVRARKRASRYSSDDDLIAADLKGKGYDDADIAVFLNSRNPHRAAVKLVAHYEGRTVTSVAKKAQRGELSLRARKLPAVLP